MSAADREFCKFAAELLMSMVDPGPPREEAAERLMRQYRDDFAAAHPGADSPALEEAMLTFGGALLLEMERVGLAHTTEAEAGHA